MQGGEKLSLDKIRALMAASEELRFTGHSRKDIYAWVETTMREQGYRKQSREGKGLLRSYIAKMTGLSRAQVTRLIAKYSATGAVKPALYGRHRFTVRYTRRDAELLAMVDEAHQTVVLENLILRCTRAEYTVFEGEPLDVTRPTSSADKASCGASRARTRCPSMGPCKSTEQCGWNCAEDAFMRRGARNDDAVRRLPASQ